MIGSERVDLDWIPTLPKEWEVGVIGRDTWVRARLGWKGLTASEYVDQGIPMLSTPDIKGREIDFGGANKVTLERYEESPEIQLSLGDVLLTKDGSTIGTVNVVRELPGPATVNGSIAVLTARSALNGRFLYRFIASSYAQALFERLRGGMGVPHLFQADIKRIRYPRPPLAVQSRIADFLDRETAQIDTLISEQKRLIELVDERRTAVVRQTLQPHEKWKVTRVKWVAESCLGKMLDAGKGLRPGEVVRPYVRAADVLNTGEVNFEGLNEMPYNEQELQRLDLRAGDVLVIEGGATVGRPGMVRCDQPGVSFQKTVNRVRCGPELDPRFMYWTLKKRYDEDYYSSYYGAVSFVHLTGEKLRELPLGFPPLEEQRRLVDDLEEEIRRLDGLKREADRLIDLARERRAALITAAVTGQIEITGVN